MRMLRPIKNALANFAIPIRVDGARLLSFLRRRSNQRLIHTATNTNNVKVNSSFRMDQTVMRLLPAEIPMLSSVMTMGSSQPRYSAAMASQITSATRVSQSFIHDLLPRLAANNKAPTRTMM